jgi:hypothetical protein
VLYVAIAILPVLAQQVPENPAKIEGVGAPPAAPSEIVTVAAVVLLLTVAITFTMPVVSKARSRFESEAGD